MLKIKICALASIFFININLYAQNTETKPHYTTVNNIFSLEIGMTYSEAVATLNSKPINVLNNEGIDYLEIRCIDLNPNTFVGISEEQIYFLDLLILFCFLETADSKNFKNRRLKKNGLEFEDTYLKLYESMLPPLLRYFHIYINIYINIH